MVHRLSGEACPLDLSGFSGQHQSDFNINNIFSQNLFIDRVVA